MWRGACKQKYARHFCWPFAECKPACNGPHLGARTAITLALGQTKIGQRGEQPKSRVTPSQRLLTGSAVLAKHQKNGFA